jgi:hypothetical protein
MIMGMILRIRKKKVGEIGETYNGQPEKQRT